MKYFNGIALFIATLFSQPVMATILGQIGGASITPTAMENFEGFGWTGDGVTWAGTSITVKNIGFGAEFYWGPTAQFTTNALYQNGGAHGPISVSLNSGELIGAIQFDLSSGWTGPSGGTSLPQYYWVRALLDGLFTGYEFDLDLPNAPNTVSLISAGTAFDEVQVFSYYTSAVRDSHNFTELSGAAIDNIEIEGSGVVSSPAVPGLILLGLAGLSWSRTMNYRRAL
jgi:hypothetical protein